MKGQPGHRTSGDRQVSIPCIGCQHGRHLGARIDDEADRHPRAVVGLQFQVHFGAHDHIAGGLQPPVSQGEFDS